MRNSRFFGMLALPFFLAGCGRTTIGVETNPDLIKATPAAAAENNVLTCPDPSKVVAGVEYACADGKKRKGVFLAKSLPECSKDGETGCLAVIDYPAVQKAGLATKLVSTASAAGVTGAVVLPLAADVRSSVGFGAISGVIGSYSPDLPDVANVRIGYTVGGVAGTLADCISDGATGCFVPATGTIKAADTTGFTGWDIRRKRSSNGTVRTFAGLTTQSKTCRNRARTDLYDNTTAPADAGLDVFDTIDDYNGDVLGLPGEIPAWSMIAPNFNLGSDYACGGIYATGNTATGNTGADASLAHSADGNWQDLTPGIIPAATPTNSSNTANGCNATDKHCVFLELISGLMVTEVSATRYTWQEALTYCHDLGEAGGAVTNEIPVIGGVSYSDWRLPTQKELMQLYNAGIRGLNQTTNLKTNFGNVDTYFFSSSSVSTNTSYAWNVNLYYGFTFNSDKTDASRAVCVR